MNQDQLAKAVFRKTSKGSRAGVQAVESQTTAQPEWLVTAIIEVLNEAGVGALNDDWSPIALTEVDRRISWWFHAGALCVALVAAAVCAYTAFHYSGMSQDEPLYLQFTQISATVIVAVIAYLAVGFGQTEASKVFPIYFVVGCVYLPAMLDLGLPVGVTLAELAKSVFPRMSTRANAVVTLNHTGAIILVAYCLYISTGRLIQWIQFRLFDDPAVEFDC